MLFVCVFFHINQESDRGRESLRGGKRERVCARTERTEHKKNPEWRKGNPFFLQLKKMRKSQILKKRENEDEDDGTPSERVKKGRNILYRMYIYIYIKIKLDEILNFQSRGNHSKSLSLSLSFFKRRGWR